MLVAVMLLLLLLPSSIVILHRLITQHRDGFRAGEEPPLSLLHVRAPHELVLELGRMGRTPLSLPRDAQMRLVPFLESGGGLRIVVAGGGKEEDDNGRLAVTDAATLALKLADATKQEAQLLAVLLQPEASVFLFLVVAVGPDSMFTDATSVPPLSSFVRRSTDNTNGNNPQNRNKGNRRLTVRCGSELEARLFEVAWAIAGGGDLFPSSAAGNGEDDGVVIVHEGSRTRADVQVVWSCIGGSALAEALQRARASTPSEAAFMAYHPSDDARATAESLKAAPSIARARAPVLVLSVPSPMPGQRTSLTLLSSPSLVVAERVPDGSDGSGIAAAVSAALLAGDHDAVAWCTFFEAAGLVRLGDRGKDIARSLTAKRVRSVQASPYGLPAVPVLEQFSSSPSDPSPLDPVELVPCDSVDAVFTPRLGGRGTAATLPSASVAGVQLRRGDRVYLTRQERGDRENGLYVAVSPTVLHSPLGLDPDEGTYVTSVRPARPADGSGSSSSSGTDAWCFSLPHKGLTHSLHVGDAAAWLPLPGPPVGTVVSSSPSAGITVCVAARDVVADPESEALVGLWLDPLSVCTAAGWDRPCERDSDCPFLSARRQNAADADERGGEAATTYRGVCLRSGYCEMPVGVRAVGYRHSDPLDRTLCRCTGGSTTTLVSAASQACCHGGGAPEFELERLA